MSSASVSSRKTKSGRNNPPEWDDDKTEILLEALDEEVLNGNRTARTFSKTGWGNIVNKFQCRTGLDYGEGQLKNRHDNLRREFKTWERLVHKEPGLGWDYRKRTVTAPEWKWVEMAEVDPSILKFKYGPPVHLELMETVFMGINATGSYEYIPGYVKNSSLDKATCFTSECDPANLDVPTPSSSKLTCKKRRRGLNNGRLSEADNTSVLKQVRPSEEETISYADALALFKGMPGMGPSNPHYIKGVMVLKEKIRRIAFVHLLENYGADSVIRWLSTFPDV